MIFAALILATLAPASPAARADGLAAVACSDARLRDYATKTQEPVDTIAQAAVEACRPLWEKVADNEAGDLKGAERDAFKVAFVNGIFVRFLQHARPIAIELRQGR